MVSIVMTSGRGLLLVELNAVLLNNGFPGPALLDTITAFDGCFLVALNAVCFILGGKLSVSSASNCSANEFLSVGDKLM